MLDLLTYVAGFPHDNRPCTIKTCQTFMLLKHGNRKDTVRDYINELIDIDILKENHRTGDINLKRGFEETLALFAAAGASLDDSEA